VIRRLLLMLSLALAGAALAPAPSHAFSGCSFNGGTLNVFMNQDLDTITIARGGEGINVIGGDLFGEGPEILLNCTGGTPTVNNTDRIVVDEAAVAAFTGVFFDLAGGPMAPGLTPEADGTSEIELQANLFGGLSFTSIGGSAGDDTFHLGRAASGATGVNFNAGAEAAPDVDLELTQPELVSVGTGRGNDVVHGRGAPGFAGPTGARIATLAVGGSGRDDLIAGSTSAMIGGPNNDRLLGSRFEDDIVAGGGRDLIKTGRGPDTILAARGGRDRVNCGASRRDRAVTDGTDRVGNCERDRLRLAGPDVVFSSSPTSRLSQAWARRDLSAEMIELGLDLLKRK
jgi:hypothetical protein